MGRLPCRHSCPTHLGDVGAVDGSIILNLEANPQKRQKPPHWRGLLSWYCWAKKERCHRFVRALGYISTNIPGLSRFHAWDPYLNPR